MPEALPSPHREKKKGANPKQYPERVDVGRLRVHGTRVVILISLVVCAQGVTCVRGFQVYQAEGMNLGGQAAYWIATRASSP